MTKTKVILSGTWLRGSGSFSGSHKEASEHLTKGKSRHHGTFCFSESSSSLTSLSSRLAFMLVSVVVTPETSQRPDKWIEPSFLVVFPLAPKICTAKHTIFSGTFHCHFYNMVQLFTFDFMPDRCGRSWSHCHRRSNGRWMQFHRSPGGTSFPFQPPGLKVLKYDPVARQKETSNTCDLSCVPGWFSRTPSPTGGVMTDLRFYRILWQCKRVRKVWTHEVPAMWSFPVKAFKVFPQIDRGITVWLWLKKTCYEMISNTKLNNLWNLWDI